MTEMPSSGEIPQFTLGDRLRKAREHRGLTQNELADLTGIGRRSVSTYELDSTPPRRPMILAWAMATGVPIEWLLTGEAPEPKGPVSPGGNVASRGPLAQSVEQRTFNPKFAPALAEVA